MDNNIPLSLNYNPSEWRHRLPLVIAAFVGLCIALYLSFYQMHIIGNVWDPFFGDATKKVLTSDFSKMFPIPDALLGAIGYLCDIIFGSIGGENRWRAKPWTVLVFGIVVALLALTSIVLIIAQLVFLKSACTLCLCSAIISLSIVGPAMHEVFASIHYLKEVKHQHFSVWKAMLGEHG